MVEHKLVITGVARWILEDIGETIPNGCTRKEGWALLNAKTNINSEKLKDLWMTYGTAPKEVSMPTYFLALRVIIHTCMTVQ